MNPLYKRGNISSVETFKELISTVDWILINQTLNPTDSYNIFIN